MRCDIRSWPEGHDFACWNRTLVDELKRPMSLPAFFPLREPSRSMSEAAPKAIDGSGHEEFISWSLRFSSKAQRSQIAQQGLPSGSRWRRELSDDNRTLSACEASLPSRCEKAAGGLLIRLLGRHDQCPGQRNTQESLATGMAFSSRPARTSPTALRRALPCCGAGPASSPELSDDNPLKASVQTPSRLRDNQRERIGDHGVGDSIAPRV